MATLALFAVGAAVGGSTTVAGGLTLGVLLGAAGAAGGAYIDQVFTYPLIFGTGDPLQGPRLKNFNVQGASEGDLIKRVYGPDNRVYGTLIWASDLFEHESTESVGGGKNSSKVSNFSYTMHIAVLICLGPIRAVNRIWMDGKLIYTPSEDIVVTDNSISAEAFVVVNAFNEIYNQYWYLVNSGVGGPDLTVFDSGQTVTIEGFANAGNNGDFIVDHVETEADTSTTIWIRAPRPPVPPQPVTEAAGATVTITQTTGGLDPKVADSVEIYLGDYTQVEDPTIQAIEGDDTSAYVGRAYAVFTNLQFRETGNHIPQFSFETDAFDFTVAELVAQIIEDAGLTSDDYDVTGIDDEDIRGFIVEGPQEPATVLEQVMLRYDLVAIERRGVLVFTQRSDSDQTTVLVDELGAREPGTAPVSKVQIDDVANYRLPQVVEVTYIDPANKFQQGSQSHRRQFALSDNIESFNFPMVMGEKAAQRLARRLLYGMWIERNTAKITLPPSRIEIVPGQTVVATDELGNDFRMRVIRIDRGVNYLLALEGVAEPSDTFDFDEPDDEGGYDGPPDDPPQLPIALTLAVPDLPAINDADLSVAGHYAAVCASDYDATYLGSSLYQSPDDSTFSFLDLIPAESTLGRSLTALADGSVEYIDAVNTVDVLLLHGSLSNATEDQVMMGANRIAIGEEIISFMTAVEFATNKWRLSNLLRGQRGTEAATSGHGADEKVILLNSAVKFVPISISELGMTHYYKAAVTGTDLDDVASEALTHAGNTLRHFSPTAIAGERDGSNNLTITWSRRSRVDTPLFGIVTPPLLDVSESYEVDIYSGPSVVRTIVSTTATAAYSAAEQTADGLTPGDPVVLKVYQIHSIVGRSASGDATV